MDPFYLADLEPFLARPDAGALHLGEYRVSNRRTQRASSLLVRVVVRDPAPRDLP